MPDLTTRITEALDQAERLARDAKNADAQGHWSVTLYGPSAPLGSSNAVTAFWEYVTNPASVLRSVAADRRVLQRHWRNGGACEACWRVLPTRTEGVPWPCADILDLADRLGVTRKDSTDE